MLKLNKEDILNVVTHNTTASPGMERPFYEVQLINMSTEELISNLENYNNHYIVDIYYIVEVPVDKPYIYVTISPAAAKIYTSEDKLEERRVFILSHEANKRFLKQKEFKKAAYVAELDERSYLNYVDQHLKTLYDFAEINGAFKRPSNWIHVEVKLDD